MAKATLEYDLEDPQDVEAFTRANKALDMALAFFEIGNEIFRPVRKHGYSDSKLNELVEKTEDASEIIGLLENKYYEILREHGINVDELVS